MYDTYIKVVHRAEFTTLGGGSPPKVRRGAAVSVTSCHWRRTASCSGKPGCHWGVGRWRANNAARQIGSASRMLSGRDADDEEVAVVDPEVAQLAADLEWADRVEERLGAEVTNAGKKRRRVFVRHFRALTFRQFIFVGAGHTLSRRQRRAAEQAQNHAHCKLATISVVRDGILQSFEDVDAVLDRMDYMMQAHKGDFDNPMEKKSNCELPKQCHIFVAEQYRGKAYRNKHDHGSFPSVGKERHGKYCECRGGKRAHDLVRCS